MTTVEQLTDRQARVLEVVRTGDFSGASIARKTGLSRSSVEAALYLLQRRGLLQKTSSGWRLP